MFSVEWVLLASRRSRCRGRGRPRAGTPARTLSSRLPAPSGVSRSLAIRYAKCFMCQAITLLTASVPRLAGSPLWPSSCRSHCCPVSAIHVHVRLEHREHAATRRASGRRSAPCAPGRRRPWRAPPRRCSRGWWRRCCRRRRRRPGSRRATGRGRDRAASGRWMWRWAESPRSAVPDRGSRRSGATAAAGRRVPSLGLAVSFSRCSADEIEHALAAAQQRSPASPRPRRRWAA